MEMIILATSKEDVDVVKLYSDEAFTKKDEFLSKYHINPNGITIEDANR